MRAWLGTALLVGLVGLAACGGGSDAITGPPPTLTGSWLFTDFSLQGEAQGIRVNCGFTDLRLELTQNGSELTGTHSAATATCSGGGRSESDQVPAGQVAGSLAGAQVTLRLDAGEPLSGTLSPSGTEIRGTVSIPVPDVGTLSGRFVLVRL